MSLIMITEAMRFIEEADAVLLEETKYEEVEVVEFEETLADEELEGYEVSDEITEENQDEKTQSICFRGEPFCYYGLLGNGS